jgi:Ala-tRNA(Pro) deacylase
MAADRAGLLRRFAELDIETTTREHPPVFTVEQARAHCADIPGVHCKNLFFKDAKGTLWLVVVPDHRVLELKRLHEKIGAKRLSFGNAELLREVLGVEPGSVTPFALINDIERRVNVVLDAWMMRQPILNYHPLENSATTTLRSDDLLKFIRSCGHEPRIVELGEGEKT